MNITLLEDEILENNEEFTIFLSSAESNVITGPQSTVTIKDNEGTGYSTLESKYHLYIYYVCSLFSAVLSVNFSEPVYTVSEGGGQVEVCAVLTGQTARNVIVTIVAETDTALGNIMRSGRIIFTIQFSSF